MAVSIARRLIRSAQQLPNLLARNSLDPWLGHLLNCLAIIRRVALRRVTFIGVTGSCGKTTTIALSSAVLSSAGRCWAGGGPNRWLVAQTIVGLSASTKFCVQELHASNPGDIGKFLRLFKPQIGAVTTVGGDHYKNYRSLEATAREKGRLVECLPPHGVAILNADDPNVRGMVARTHARVITFGLSPDAELRATEVSGRWPDRLSFTATYSGQTVSVVTQLVGDHWVTAVLAAIAIGIACGLGLRTCAEAVKSVDPVFGRYSAHVRSDGTAYILDTYKAPLWTIARGLDFVRSARAPRTSIVFGMITDYAGNGARVYRRLAREALEVADRVIFIGQNSGHIDKLRRGEVRDRLFDFPTTYQGSAFLARDVMPGELIYVKSDLSEHLERIMLSQLDEVLCWQERCGKNWRFCTTCPKYRKAVPAPPVSGRVIPANGHDNQTLAVLHRHDHFELRDNREQCSPCG